MTVTIAPSSAKAITAFSINGTNGIIDEGPGTIAVEVPHGTEVTNLTPTITYTGKSISPTIGTPKDFTSPVTYTVTADDNSTKEYTVTVTIAASTAKAITKFSLAGADGDIILASEEACSNKVARLL